MYVKYFFFSSDKDWRAIRRKFNIQIQQNSTILYQENIKSCGLYNPANTHHWIPRQQIPRMEELQSISDGIRWYVIVNLNTLIIKIILVAINDT